MLLALGPVSTNPVTVTLAQAADCAMLCVLLGQMHLADAKHTIEEIGHQHFVGAVTLGCVGQRADRVGPTLRSKRGGPHVRPLLDVPQSRRWLFDLRVTRGAPG